MFFDQFKRAYVRRVQDRITGHERHLGVGRASSYDQYRYTVGEIAGMRRALEILDETIKSELTEEDEDGDIAG